MDTQQVIHYNTSLFFDKSSSHSIFYKLQEVLLMRRLLINRKKGITSTAKNSASSTDEPPCSFVDCEFWQSKNIAPVITTAIRGGTEPSSF